VAKILFEPKTRFPIQDIHRETSPCTYF